MPPQKSIRNSLQWTAYAALMTAALYPATESRAVENIQQYCVASWRNAGIQEVDWNDCTQEAMANLLERVSRKGLVPAIQQPKSQQRRELNRSIWRTTQRWRRAKRPASLESMEHYEPEQATPKPTPDGGDVEALQDALATLSPLQQQILRQWSEGESVADIAKRLDVSAPRVSDQKYKALAKLKQRLAT